MKIAVIDETKCVGCTKCLDPCPTDAIIGAEEQMHTVINELCIGCTLCIAPCPMDCISLIEVDQPKKPLDIIKTRIKNHNNRLLARQEQKILLDKRGLNKKDLLASIINKSI